MRTKLTLAKETLAELTSDEMATVIGGHDSDSCTCTGIGVICINVPNAIVIPC